MKDSGLMGLGLGI